MQSSVVLDVTRLVSRLGRGALTGIDRVELAYLQNLPSLCENVFGLLRTPAGVLLLDRTGLHHLGEWSLGATLPKHRDLLTRLIRKDAMLGAIETALRSISIARLRVGALPHKLPELLGPFLYLNVGHSNLSAKMLKAIRSARGHVVVMIHDVIPLDFPQFARDGQHEVFAQKLRAVSQFSDAVIHLTEVGRSQTDHWFSLFGRVPRGIVAPLGVPVPRPDPVQVPSDLLIDQPYFIMVGTVEPRKNHEMILQIWETLPEPVPQLFILGNRGWASDEVFRRLDAGQKNVHFRSGLGDGATAALVQGARALLFPTFAEGFGLPPYEAAALGTPVIASDISVTREGLHDFPVYVSPTDSYSWRETILAHCVELSGTSIQKHPRQPPAWADHFKLVLSNL